MAASRTLDRLPRSPVVRKKKRRRDRLMEVAAADPEWAVGFEDECWWSRVALPTLSSWAEEGKPMRLVQQSVAKDDPEPRRPSPATGSTCRSSIRRGCASWMAGPSVERRADSLSGVAKSSKLLASRFCF